MIDNYNSVIRVNYENMGGLEQFKTPTEVVGVEMVFPNLALFPNSTYFLPNAYELILPYAVTIRPVPIEGQSTSFHFQYFDGAADVAENFWLANNIFSAGGKVVVVGRDRSSTIQLDEVRAQAASRRHVAILPSNGGYFVQDLNSTNGTYAQPIKQVIKI